MKLLSPESKAIIQVDRHVIVTPKKIDSIKRKNDSSMAKRGNKLANEAVAATSIHGRTIFFSHLHIGSSKRILSQITRPIVQITAVMIKAMQTLNGG